MSLDIVVKAVDQASPIIEKINGVVGGLANIAGGVLTAGLSAATAGLAGITAAAGAFIAKTVSSNAEFERYNAQFTVLLGSTELAKERLEELAEFGATTPFELPEVVRADKILQAFGLHAEAAAERFGFSGEQIRTIAGDVASGAGASFEEIASYIGKFASGATGEAIARFQELGIVTREQMAEMGLEFSKSGELLSPLPESMNVLLSIMEEKYGGLMQVQSTTFEGMMSNLQDWINGTIRELGAPIFDLAKEQLGNLLSVLSSDAVQGAIKVIPDSFKLFEGDIVGAIANILFSFDKFVPGLASIGDAFLDVATIAGDAFSKLSGGMEQFFDMVLERGVPLSIALRSSFGDLIPPEVATTIGALSAAFQEHTGLIQRAVEGLATYVLEQFALMDDTLLTNVTTALTALADFWSTWGDEIIMIVTGLVGIIITTIAGAMTLFSGIIAATLQLINGDWDGAWQTMGETLTTFLNQALALVDTNLAAVQASWEGTLNLMVITVTTIFTNIVNAVTTAMTNFMNEVKKGISAALAAASEFVSQASEVGTGIINAMIEGVVAAAGGLAQAAISAVQNALSAAGGALSGATGTGGPGVGGGNAPAFGGGSGGGGGGGSTTSNTLIINTPVAPAIPYEFQQASANAGGR